MAELILSDLDDGVLHALEERAQCHGRTAPEEAKSLLSEALSSKSSGPWASVDAIYNRLASSGRSFSDSADLLREDRDR